MSPLGTDILLIQQLIQVLLGGLPAQHHNDFDMFTQPKSAALQNFLEGRNMSTGLLSATPYTYTIYIILLFIKRAMN
jgi:hypothetical protein